MTQRAEPPNKERNRVSVGKVQKTTLRQYAGRCGLKRRVVTRAQFFTFHQHTFRYTLLATMRKHHWKDAEGRSKITLDVIQRAATDGARFLAHLDKQPTSIQLQQAALHRQKAWSFLDLALTEVIDTGRYLFRKQDPLTRYPNLQRSTPTKKTSPPTPQPTPTPPTT